MSSNNASLAPLTISHTSFANSDKHLVSKASTAFRFGAIMRYFAKCSEEKIDLVCFTEHNRPQCIHWPSVNEFIEINYGYKLVNQAFVGDYISKAFSSVMYLNLRTQNKIESENITVTHLTRSINGKKDFMYDRAAVIRFINAPPLVYCHLPLTLTVDHPNTRIWLEMLEGIAEKIDEGCIVFGTFNIVPTMRKYLETQRPELLKRLKMIFGGERGHISFTSMPHDRTSNIDPNDVDDYVYKTYIEDDGSCTYNVIDALNCICGENVTNVRRKLPYGDFTEVPLSATFRDIKEMMGELPDIRDWVSDQWLLYFEIPRN